MALNMTEKQAVLVVGATGRTGSSIIDGLLESRNFNVAAAVRPASQNKQIVSDMAARGVDIRLLDLETPGADLDGALRDVDIIISPIKFNALQFQKPLIDAAKRCGVKRFIPSDFASPCPRGVRSFHDMKLDIHDYIKQLGLPYTFIDVGWWYQALLPSLKRDEATAPIMFEMERYFYGTNMKTAVMDRRDVGLCVAKIISDPRTLNRYVFCWGEEVTQRELFAIAEKAAGEPIPVKITSEAELKKLLDESKSAGPTSLLHIFWGYHYTDWIRGNNTVENAKKPEYGLALDARELYPDFEPRKFIDTAYEFYSK